MKSAIDMIGACATGVLSLTPPWAAKLAADLRKGLGKQLAILERQE